MEIMNRALSLFASGVLSLVVSVLLCANTFAATPASSSIEVFDEGVPVANKGGATLKPYGFSLFGGSYAARKQNELDPDYQVEPGDRIALRIWGGETVNETLSVDSNGNIFVPDVGEIRMTGVKSSAVSSTIKREVSKVYKDGVDVYANLLSSTLREVQIFVTGNVVRPGQYVGSPEDSVLAFLHRAGGVDPRRGSYRYVLVQRGKQRLAVIDLYNFINNGDLPKVLFRNGDTIVVRPQGNMISVYGEARNNFRFEFLGSALNGAQLARYARPESSVTNVALSGTRNGLPHSSYLSYAQFLRTRLLDGDTVWFVSDSPSPVIDISIEGSHLGNSYFAVKRGSRLQEVLDYISVNPDDADISNVYIKRKRVAEEQKKNIDAALHRLERSVLTAPAQSDGEASIRVKEAELILKFVERASTIKSEGRVVVADRGSIANIRLEDGDVIVIPAKSDVVTISGEVQIPQAVVYASNASIHDYIAQAGGYTERANRQRLVVVKPNGKVVIGEVLRVEAGDSIIVYPEVDAKNVQAAKDIIQIIYQIAVAASAVGL